jgi:superfamily I DNA/RNA helicase
LRLPAFEDLSKEQDVIYNLELDGNYIVSGPPGTGKSVMALYRAQALTIDDRQPAVLMYNNVLQQYTAQAARSINVSGYITTFHKWLSSFWRTHYGSTPPTLESSSYDHDWGEIAQIFLSRPPSDSKLNDLLVDEGQDLALGFFRMARFLAKNITVFADENQQIKDHNTTLTEIEKAIGAREHLVLDRNYRNSREIAELAKHYYCGTPTGIPKAPSRKGAKPILQNFANLNELVEFVVAYVSGRTNLSIGIACPSAKLQTKLMNRLELRDLGVPIQMYSSKSADPRHKSLDFVRAGITLVHYQSLKGLEFDTLFVPGLEQSTQDHTSAATRMLFYVVMSRARDELYISWTGSGSTPPIVADLGELVEHR